MHTDQPSPASWQSAVDSAGVDLVDTLLNIIQLAGAVGIIFALFFIVARSR